ncbi:hypothetical protein TNCV_592111 [Trichonephila clavipes]|nr:hypothetical protein TNCV_592111 [Trichonephila clavipes]
MDVSGNYRRNLPMSRSTTFAELSFTQGLLATNLVILNHSQVTKTTPEGDAFLKRIVRQEPSQADCGIRLRGLEQEDDNILKRFITADEAWWYHCDPTIKQQSSEWKHPSSPTTKKEKKL